MFVFFRSSPDGGERHHVGEIESLDRRLANVGIDVSRQASEPGFHRVDGLADAGEVAALNGFLDWRSRSSAIRGSLSHTVTVAVT